ncbi:MAG: transcription antitermination factor NusB [Treponemataceae bacterium]|nr:MAG: transcription antitermination factor NusB [Treponemataceae bacterium]
MSRRKGRILAFQGIFAWDASHAPIEQISSFSWETEKNQKKIDEDDAVFARLLLAGAIENIAEIDRLISANIQRWDIDRLNKTDLAVLRISIYSFLYQKDIHPTIIIDEGVSIAKHFGTDESYKFINAILDSIKTSMGLDKVASDKSIVDQTVIGQAAVEK